MMIESFRWLAGLIAAHPDRQVVGRTRMQKTVFLLQRLGFPTDYRYSLHFYGPYSDGLKSELKLARELGLITEDSRENVPQPYSIYTATEAAVLPDVDRFRPAIDLIRAAEDVPLELAATYVAFRRIRDDHDEALDLTRRKKGPKCDGGNLDHALDLLKQLGLPHDAGLAIPV